MRTPSSVRTDLRRLAPLVLAALVLGLLSPAVTARPAQAAGTCHSHTFKNLGPKHLANAKGKVRALWCVRKNKTLYNIRLSGSVEVTNLGLVQGYRTVSKLGPAKNMAGDKVAKNPKNKTSQYFYFGYKIAACVPSGPCAGKTSYHWKLGLGNKGGHSQVYKGKYS